ncbi:MAG: alpha-glucan family phosphorylase [Saprospirales bacterium]|nr:alpha-glucan family phosphorylase [Saprospirales bacterium]
MQTFTPFKIPYTPDKRFGKKVAYFSMEFAIDQALKIYSGGLGYLAGSHMRSAFQLKQNLVGIGILWKYGYYDQVRKGNGEMDVLRRERFYNFLTDTGIIFDINVNRAPVKVKAFYLAPEVFGSAPMFLLSTDLPENDWLAQTISHHLYDSNTEAKVAQYILLGKGGAKLLDLLGWEPDVYHFNEAHAMPAAFHLYEKFRDLDEVRERIVFTTHTPVEAGNEKHELTLLDHMSFFGDLTLPEVRTIAGVSDQTFNQTLAGLRMARIANGVSKMHGEVARQMWGEYEGISPITHVTNSQNHLYWHDPELDRAGQKASGSEDLKARKRSLKQNLFRIVADQTGKIFDPDTLTIVWARRFARYKRADLITRDAGRFEALLSHTERPVQIIWAGKPYPTDHDAVEIFNHLVHLSNEHPNMAVLTGYELGLSKALKQGSDIWLNTPRITREASGTSGMTAAMNGSVNLSIPDGWVPEFGQHGRNAFVLPAVDSTLSGEEQDRIDLENLYRVLEEEVLPRYYAPDGSWWKLVRQSMQDIRPFFDADRMAREYYEVMYGVWATIPL